MSTKVTIERTLEDGSKESVTYNEKGKIIEVKKTTSADGCGGCCGCITLIIFIVGFFTILGWLFPPL